MDGLAPAPVPATTGAPQSPPADEPDAGASPATATDPSGAVPEDAAAGALATPPPALAVESRCGPPPYQALRLRARDVMAQSELEVGGVVVTLKHCPRQSFSLSPAHAGANLLVTAGAETWIRFDAPGYVPWVVGEVKMPERARVLPVEAMLVPRSIIDVVVPGWKADTSIVYVEVRSGRLEADEACRSPAGVTLSVKDHPRAAVLYRGKGANPTYRGGLATSEEGVALITGLPAVATAIELVASKPGCVYQAAFGDANSPELWPILRAPLFGGAITHQVVNPAR